MSKGLLSQVWGMRAIARLELEAVAWSLPKRWMGLGISIQWRDCQGDRLARCDRAMSG